MNPQAALYMTLSALAFALMDLLVKELSGGYGAFELVFFRSGGTWLLCMIYLLVKGVPLLGNQRNWLVFRSVVGTISLCLFFYAIQLIPLGSAVAIRYVSPIFGVVFALLFLNEKVRPLQWLFFAMSFGGVLLINGFDPRITTLGLVVVLGSALFSGLVFLSIRRLGTGEHPLVIVNYFMFTAMLVGGVGSWSYWVVPPPSDYLFLLGLGVLGLFGQVFMTMALQLEVASKVTPFKYLEAVFVIVFSYFIFAETQEWIAIVGIGLIILGNVLNALLKKAG